MLNIKKTIENGEAVFKLDGRLDTSSAPAFDAEMKQSLEGVTSLVLDFEKLEYISSAGLRSLLLALKLLRNKGRVKVIHVNELVMEVLEVTGFAEMLTIE